jgi:hypothetical protein
MAGGCGRRILPPCVSFGWFAFGLGDQVGSVLGWAAAVMTSLWSPSRAVSQLAM